MVLADSFRTGSCCEKKPFNLAPRLQPETTSTGQRHSPGPCGVGTSRLPRFLKLMERPGDGLRSALFVSAQGLRALTSE